MKLIFNSAPPPPSEKKETKNKNIHVAGTPFLDLILLSTGL